MIFLVMQCVATGRSPRTTKHREKNCILSRMHLSKKKIKIIYNLINSKIICSLITLKKGYVDKFVFMVKDNVYDFSAEQPEEIQSTLQRQLRRKIKKKTPVIMKRVL
jgi:hypothetical protein